MLFLTSPLFLFKWNSTLLPGTEVIMWDRLESPLVNILFTTKLLSLDPLSWDMDCLLTLWPSSSLVPLVTVTVHLIFWSSSLTKETSCTTAYMYSQKNHYSTFAPSELGSPCLSFSLSLSLSLRLSLSLSYRQLSTARSRSIKGLQHYLSSCYWFTTNVQRC